MRLPKKQKIIQVKEIKLRPGTDENDYQVKMRNIKRFIEDGDKVKVTLRFRGREMAYTESGRNLLMKYFIGADHAGIEIKAFVKDLFEQRGHEVEDLGPYNKDRVDYPDFAAKVCKKVLENSGSMGILICGSGIGMSMAANKFDGIRAALCHNEYSARMARKHNDANVLCLGERVSGEGMIEAIIKAWDKAEFEEGRHTQRVEKINALSKIGNCRA